MNKQPFILLLAVLMLNSVSLFAQVPDTVPVAYRRLLFDFDPLKPTFKFTGEQLSNKNRFLRVSLLTGYREGVEPIDIFGHINFSSKDDKETGTKRLYMYNASIIEMLSFGVRRSPNAVVLEVKDPSKYRYDSSQGSKYEWMRKNAYCFELILPSASVKSADILRSELSRVFGVKTTTEKRQVNALVLVRTSTTDKIKSKGKGKPRYNDSGRMNNIELSRLSSILYDAGMPTMVDETGYTDPVDLDLNITSWTDLTAIRKALQRYDLDLKEETRKVEMFVITELK